MSFSIYSQAQLKIGDNPTNIQKSSILELESSRQGLLLPRLPDTVQINQLNPPDGMIVYLNSDKSLRLRSNGAWKKIADLSEASANWSLKGNSGTNPASDFLGTVDGQPLVVRTNNAERLRVDADGNIGIGTNNPTAKLTVDGTVKLTNLDTGNSELDVLVLNADGSVYKRTMSSAAFENAIKAVNGIQKQSLSITAQATNTKDEVLVENRAADSTIAIYLPVMDSTATSARPYGLLTNSDWTKIQNAVQTVTIGVVAATPNAKGASIATNGTGREIILHAADAAHAGIVTAGAQTFGGNKTFQDSLSAAATMKVGSTGTANSTMQVEGSLSMAIRTVTANTTIAATDNTLLVNTTSAAVTVTLPAPANISGRIYTIKKIGTGGIDKELTISPAGGATIDGGASYVIYNDYTFVTLQTDGTNWYIIRK